MLAQAACGMSREMGKQETGAELIFVMICCVPRKAPRLALGLSPVHGILFK